MEDAAQAYESLCKIRNAKVSSELTKELRGRACGRITELDLQRVYVAKSMVPLIADLITLFSNLQILDLCRAQLNNDSIALLYDVLVAHPSIHTLDFSHNEISLPAAKLLFDLACNNTNIVSISLSDTDMSDAYRNRIAMQLELNRGKDIQKKELSYHTGDSDMGIGMGTILLRKTLGYGPPEGPQDEEWEVDSNLEDNLFAAAAEETEAKAVEAERVLAATPGCAEYAADTPLEQLVFNSADDTDTDQIQRTPLRPQDLVAISRSLFNPKDGEDKKWTDETFPPSEVSLVTSGFINARKRRTKDIFWVRASEASPTRKDPKLFVDVQKPSCPMVGAFGNMWLCTTLQILRRYPQMLRHLFIRSYPDIGAYQIQIFKSGTWMQVVIDDYVPCDHAGRLLGITMSDPNEVWAPLIEKAMAKLYGGYDRLACGSTLMALSDLTGGICNNIFIRNHKRAREVATDGSYWNTLRGYVRDGCIVSACVKTISDTETASIAESGIIANRMYEILQVIETPNWRVVQLYASFLEAAPPPPTDSYNPIWLTEEWMQKLPEKDYRLVYPHFHMPAEAAAEKKVWVSFEHFCIFFNKVYICRTEATLTAGISASNVLRLTSRWVGRTAGGKLRCQNFTENPCFNLCVRDRDTLVHIQLSQPDCKLLRKNHYEHSLGLYVVKSNDNTRKKRHWEPSDVVVIPKFYSVRDVHAEVLCRPGVNYFVIPCTKVPGESRFQLTFASPHPYIVDEVGNNAEAELQQGGVWKGYTAAGRTSGYPAWANNPQYCLKLTEGPAKIALLLHQHIKPGALPHYVSYSVYASDGGRVGPHHEGKLLHSPDFAPYETVFTEVELQAGMYTIVPMTWGKDEEGTFTLSVITTKRAVLSPLLSLLSSE